MTSSVFPDRKKNSSPDKKPKREKRIFSKGNFIKAGVGLGVVGVLGGYVYTNAHSINYEDGRPTEVAYSVNNLSFSDPVKISTDEGFHIWPFSGGVPPWPFGRTAELPLQGSHTGLTVNTPMYSINLDHISWSTTPGSEDSFALHYGPYALSPGSLEEAVDGENSGFVEAIFADGTNVKAAEQAVLSDIHLAMGTTLRGKSVEDIQRLAQDEDFMEYLISEVETALPFIEIDSMSIGSVRRAPGVITVTTADGFDVDMTLSTGFGRADRLTEANTDMDVVRDIFADHYLLELRSGELPQYIADELVESLGLNQEVVLDYGMFGDFYTGNTRQIYVDLGNAEDQFYRTFFNSGWVVIQRDFAGNLEDGGDLLSAIEMYEGILESEKVSNLSLEATGVVADAKARLGVIHEDLGRMAFADGEYEAAADYTEDAVNYYLDFLRTAPISHQYRQAISDITFGTYSAVIDFDSFKLHADVSDEDLLAVISGGTYLPPEPAEPVEPVEPAEEESTTEG